jgi:hypothetical protein
MLPRSRRQAWVWRPVGSRTSTRFNSYSVVGATAGTGPDGEVPVGTGAAMNGAVVSAGAALPDGAAGADRPIGRRQFVRPGQVGRESVRRAQAGRELIGRVIVRAAASELIGRAAAVPERIGPAAVVPGAAGPAADVPEAIGPAAVGPEAIDPAAVVVLEAIGPAETGDLKAALRRVIDTYARNSIVLQ